MEKLSFNVVGIPYEVGKIEWTITTNEEVDLAYWNQKDVNEIIVLKPRLSIGHAIALVNCLKRTGIERLFSFQHVAHIFIKKTEDMSNKDDLIKKLSRCNNNSEKALEFHFVQTNAGYNHYLHTYKVWKDKLFKDLEGKQLLLEEIITYLREKQLNHFDIQYLSQLLQVGFLEKEIDIASGVTYPIAYPSVCNRCGSTNKVFVRSCATCEDNCATCEECISQGRSKSCTPFLKFKPFQQLFYKTPQPSNMISPDVFHLNPYQNQIAKSSLEFIQKNDKKELLIWAVTGAGKTEMIFPVVSYAITNGLRILFASPRKDVIRELVPRFKQAFPQCSIVSLYGGSKEKWKSGQLYMSTTHQLIRFADFFDIAIIDEIDAFPYHNNVLLEGFVDKALKAGGRKVYMTATPKANWVKKMKSRTMEYSLLPIRYHLKPLPIPKIYMMPKKEKLLMMDKPIRPLQEFIAIVKQKKGQAFIFVSEVREVMNWTKLFKRWFAFENIEGVYAQHPHRDRIVDEFREGKIKFLVTTTIMERGITVPNTHVLVLGAESRIFDTETLIQISGRVGRSIEFPTGSIYFLSEYMTTSIKESIRHLNKMNRFADLVLRGKITLKELKV